MLLNLIYILCCVGAGAAVIWTDLAFWPSVLLGVGVWIGSFLVLALLSVAFLWLCCNRVDYEVPQQEDSAFYRKLAAVYIDALIRLLRVWVHPSGLERTPKQGRFLLVCNHQFDADPGILLHYFKDSQLAFISKQENRRLPFVGQIMHKILCQLIDREDDRQALKVILKCISLLKEDKCSIAVFPEGYCSRDGKLHRFRPGVFKIATKAKVPIVVCTIHNTRPILKNGLKGRPTDVPLHLVDVISPEQYEGLKTTQLSDLVYQKMLADLGPEFAPAEL